MKNIKLLGLLLFFVGFIIFNSLIFLSSHTVSKELLENIAGREAQLLYEVRPSLQNENFSSNFELLSVLEQAFKDANAVILEKYSISEAEINELLAEGSLKYSSENFNRVFDETTEKGAFKLKSLKDYGSWLEGKEFASEIEFREALNSVIENIRKYGIINQYGFDRYQSKDLKYQLAKASTLGFIVDNKALLLFLTFGLCIIGGLMFNLSKINQLPGIKNDHIFHKAMTNGGWLGILTGTYLILFYIVLYFFHEYMTSWILIVDPISELISGNPAGQFFLYGFMYTLVILVMGIRMILKYRHSKYQIVRNISVMFFQTSFAFIIPEILVRLNKPYFDFKNIWPLDYDFFFGSELDKLTSGGSLGIFMLVWGILLIVIAVPVFVYFFGKRWYCSWVCGHGGLAETAGDAYRQLSDKSVKAWKVERWMIHSVLVFAVVMTVAVLHTYFTGNSELMGINSYKIREVYGAWIGAGFAGVVGTGFYPFMGNRVWCRYGCPLAAYLGIVQGLNLDLELPLMEANVSPVVTAALIVKWELM